MRSRGERTRVERALRVVAWAAIALWIVNAARPAVTRRDNAVDATLAGSLPRWTRAIELDSVHAKLDTTPDATSAAWLAALRRAGVGASWSTSAATPIGVEAIAATGPEGGVSVVTSANDAVTRVVSDALGPIDTLTGASAVVRLASAEGDVTVTAGRQPARAGLPIPRIARDDKGRARDDNGSARDDNRKSRVFVSGAAGWESKFVIAALEEAGWTVDAHLFVAPERDVIQGSPSALDTARYAAAILLDSLGTAWARGLERFVRDGGGVVLAGEANDAPNARPMVAWRTAEREVAPLGTVAGDTAWRGLSRVPLVADSTRSITLESRGGRSVVVARRHFTGRVAGVGYDQTWRWRMAGGDSSRVDHRAWWSRLVGSVALRPAAVSRGAAPIASTVDILGAPTPGAAIAAPPIAPSTIANILGLIALATLLAEWFLRRARGAR